MKLKHLLASVTICAISFTTKAQIGKGSIWLGGGLSYNSTKEDNNNSIYDRKNQTFKINPGIGSAVKENTVVGLDILYSNEKQTYDPSNNPPERTVNSYGIGIFIRQYVPVINKLYIFGQGRVGYNFSKTIDKYETNESKIEGWNTSLTFNPGVSFAVNNKFQLETGLNNLLYVQYGRSKDGSNNKSNSFSAGVSVENGSPFYVGVRFLLNKKG